MKDRDIYWNRFENSGSIDAYLEYSKSRNKEREKKEDSEPVI